MTVNPAPGGASRNSRLALIASLALNVVVIGAVAGTFFFGGPHGGKEHGRSFGLMAFARKLPAERAEMIRGKFSAEESKLNAIRDRELAARDEARGVLVQEPFDQAKFKAALDKAAAADAEEKQARMAIFADTVGALTPEERQKLHAWFEKKRKKRAPKD